MRILIIEDEQPLAEGLKFNFKQEGYEAVVAPDGPTALELFREQGSTFDLVILDLMLPGVSGYETCEEIRKIDLHVPILVLSARTLSEDKTRAFESGTDQYLTKPFELPELLSRVRNLLERRSNGRGTSAGGGKDAYSFDNVHVDFRTFEVTVDGEVRRLTTTEMQLLRFFIENEGAVLSRNQILNAVWGVDSDVTTRTIDNFVLRLRKLVEDDPGNPHHFLSVRGTGYRFVANPEAASNDGE